ncbi:MAG: pyridoxal phosphate-dependent aminotransferase [Candidatus Heimdallarchaeota archaeon]
MKRLRVAKRSTNIPSSGIRRMYNIATQMNTKDMIWLVIGEPDFPTPTHIIAAGKEALNSGFTHYTHNLGLLELRESIARKLKRENRIESNPETEIIATTGAQGALIMTLFIILEEGDEVLVPRPCFASYEAQIKLASAIPVPISLEEDEFNLDLELINERITPQTKALLINSPCNPTGAMYSEAVLKAIVDLAEDQGIFIIEDNPYEKIVYDRKHVSIAPMIRDQTISIFSFSKSYAMAGWRIGYATANEEIIREMQKMHEHFCIHPSSVSQKAAIAALDGSQECVESMVQTYKERRSVIVNGLNKIPGISCIAPHGTFYVFPNIKALGRSAQDLAEYLLRECHFVTVPGTAFGPEGEGHLRISYSASMEAINEGLSRIQKAVSHLNQ